MDNGNIISFFISLNKQVFQSGIYQFKFQFFQVAVAGLKCKNRFTGKYKIQRTCFTQCAACFVKIAAHVGNGAVGVIGSGFYQYSHAMWRISFVYNFFVILFITAGGAFYSGLYPVL